MGEPRGRCLVCKRFGPLNRTKNFLCADCVNPEEIRTYCRGCGKRGKFDLLKASKSLSSRLERFLKPGTCFAFSHCNACAPAKRPLRASVYSISSGCCASN